MLSCTIRSLKLFATRLPPIFSTKFQAFRGRKQTHQGSSHSEEFSALLWGSVSSSAHPPPSFASFFWSLFLLSSLLTAYLQQPSKNRARGMSQPRGSSQHFILHGLFRLGLLKENPGGGQNLGCALGSVSGATGKREELWRTGRCLQNEKWSPLRGCRAAPQHPLGQQVNVRHREP